MRMSKVKVSEEGSVCRVDDASFTAVGWLEHRAQCTAKGRFWVTYVLRGDTSSRLKQKLHDPNIVVLCGKG